MAFPRIVPHSDGAGVIEAVGLGADLARVSQRAWVYGAQSYRPFGTAAQTTVVPEALAVDLPAAVSDEMGHAWMCWHRRASFVPPGGGAGRAAVLDWGRRLGVPPIRWAAAGSSVLVTVPQSTRERPIRWGVGLRRGYGRPHWGRSAVAFAGGWRQSRPGSRCASWVRDLTLSFLNTLPKSRGRPGYPYLAGC